MSGSISNDRQVRDRFVQLLAQSAPEPVWQDFFAKNPQALARGLPLKLEPSDVMPLGRPGRSEPDFIIYPSTPRSQQIVGVVELKRPSTKIIKQPRRNLILPTDSVQTAMGQLRQYDAQLAHFLPMQAALSFRMSSHLFMVVGMSSELKSLEAELQEQFRRLFSEGIQLLTFDQVLESFDGTLPPPIPLLLRSEPADLRYVPWERLPMLFSETRRSIYHLVAEFPYRTTKKSEIKQEVIGSVRSTFSHPLQMGWFVPTGQVGCRASESRQAAFQRELEFVKSDLRAWECERETFEYLHLGITAEGTFARLADDDEAAMLKDPANIVDSIQSAQKAISLGVDGFLHRTEFVPGRSVVIYKPSAVQKVEVLGKISFIFNGEEVREKYEPY